MVMLSKEQRKFLDQATLSYAEHVDRAAAWLAGRGIDLEFARQNGLGVVAEPMTGHESYVGRLAIPYLTPVGVVTMTFRCIKDHDCKGITGHKKYLKPSGTKSRLFGALSYDGATNFIALTEGEMDCLTLQQLDIPALGVPGAKNWQPHWSSILQDFSRVYVFSDGDDPGQEFAKKVMTEYDRAVNIPMPNGEDVNSCFVKFGGDFLKEKIRPE
jgi:hypothetical protein